MKLKLIIIIICSLLLINIYYPYTTLGLSLAIDSNSIYISGRGSSFIEGYLFANKFFLTTDYLGNQEIVKHLIGDIYSTWRSDYGGDLLFINDSVLITAGYLYNYDTLFPPLFSEHQGVLYKYKLNGDTIMTKKYIGDGYTNFARLVYDPETNKI